MANEVIYIPEYVEQGTAKLQQAKTILAQIEACINSGIATVNASGYNRGIPHIEKGNNESSDISSLESTINTITTEIQKYSNGEALELENAIIIADPATIEKYGLKKEDIDYTLSDYILKSDNVASNSTIQGKWASGYLTGGAGFIKYTGADGRLTKETWCDLNPNNLAKIMREDHGIELDYWIREDGVYMYGDYVMVAADIPHMDGTEQEAQYRKGDLVQTSLGTGMIVDLCGMAELTRKGRTDVDVWYDIYTDWHGSYSHVGYCTDAGCTDASHTNPKSKMLRKAENPTTINPRTGQPISSGFVFNSNGNNTNATTNTTTDSTTTTTTPDTTVNTNTQSSTVFDSTTTNTNTNTNTNSTNNNTNASSTTVTNGYTLQTFGPNDNNTNTSTNTNATNTSTSTSTTPSTNSYVNTNTGSSTFTPSGGSSNHTTTTTPSTSNQVSSIDNVNGFSKPVVSTPTTSTPVVNTPVVNTPVVNTPPVVSTPVVNTPAVNETPSIGTTVIPEVEINKPTDIIVSKPVETPVVPDVEIDNEIIDNDVNVEKVPMTTPADTPIEGSKNNAIPALAAVAVTGAVAAGVGVKLAHDKRKETHDNGESEEFYDEE